LKRFAGFNAVYSFSANFLLALTLLFIAAILSRLYAVVDAFLIPIILAPTIGITAYLVLATTIINYMQSPRGNQGG
jgi:hypothetical protein